MSEIRFVGRARGGRCVYCHDGLAGDVVRCPECRAAWHTDCPTRDGHCPTLGCTAPAPARTGRDRAEQVRIVGAPVVAPAWTRRAGGPGLLARLGPYSRLAVSALLHALGLLAVVTPVIAAITHPGATWELFSKGEDGPQSPVFPLLLIGGGALFLLVLFGARLRKLPGVAREVHDLLERTTPVLMDLTVEARGEDSEDSSRTYHAHLRGRHGEWAGQDHDLLLRGLFPPRWLVRRAGLPPVPVLVYGLPPPGPYILEFDDGWLALVHPE